MHEKLPEIGTPLATTKVFAISGDTLIVGATGDNSAAGGVSGSETDDSVVAAGAAYVFVRDGTKWSQQAYLKASKPRAPADGV